MLDVIKNRHSVRSYKSDSIPQLVLDELVEALRLAPSGNNNQAWKFVVVKGLNRPAVAAACEQSFVAEAPVIIAALSQKSKDDYNVAFAVENLLLQAVQHGLGSVVIRSFNEETVKEILHVPDDYHVFCLVPLGYPNGPIEINSRKPIEEIVSWETFN